jgi:RimJ/RimL family protein N-acetyltransferase
LVVRPARLDEVNAVVDLYVTVAAEGSWIAAEAPVDRPSRVERFTRSIERDDATMFVAEDEGRLVGSLGIEVRPYGVADLGMMVAADRRGTGVGSALLEAAIEWARSAGAHKVSLEVWPHNEAARGLYRKFGFEEEGLLRGQYRRRNGELWDAVPMGLLL